MIEHWDGTSWTRVDSPRPFAFSELYGIFAVSADDIWASIDGLEGPGEYRDELYNAARKKRGLKPVD